MSSFLTALIPIGLSLLTGGGGSPQQQGGGKGMNLAQSFLMSSGLLGKEGNLEKGPFSTPEIPRARSIGEMRLGSARSSSVRLDPVQQLVQSDPRVSSAINRMLTESTNRQMQDFSAKYVTRPTAAQGRKTLATKQPGDIKVR
jgi:hypothetical protein